MLALVEMAHSDPDAHRLFDLMQAYFLAHPVESGPGAMALNQTRDCRDAPDGGNRSASDGDLDIALALLMADQRWIMKASDGDPARIATSYRLDGQVPPDQETGSAAFIAMFAAGAMAGSDNASADQVWLDALWAALLNIPSTEEDYYGNTPKLSAMISLSGEDTGP